MRNPTWARDELILALDLYFRCPPNKINQDDKEVIALSRLLKSLPIHKERNNEKFRNPNGVYMKLCNFLRLDPNYSGTGLKSGGKLEKVVWGDFYDDKDKLKRISNKIKELYDEVPSSIVEFIDDGEEEFEEGIILTTLHKIKESNSSINNEKKLAVINSRGKIDCEVCGLDFKKLYGENGQKAIECHYIKPEVEFSKKKAKIISNM